MGNISDGYLQYNDYIHRDYIEKQETLREEVKVAWLSTVSELRHSCHKYFLSPIHKDLKVSTNKAPGMRP